MKISFEQMQDTNIQGRSGAERVHTPAPDRAAREEKEKRTASSGAYFVNGGGQDKKVQPGTYGKDGTAEEKMSAEELSLRAGQMDPDVQKMYMAVLSNSMSEEDFRKMLEDGYSVSDVDVETMVTILDQIKVAVAKGGGGTEGFTDGLSKETLEAILGSTAYAEAIESGLEEGTAAYMVENQMLPTAENIYRAKYSAGTCRNDPEGGIPDRESTEGKAFWAQIDRVIEDAGLAGNESGREDAVFLLRHDIPLTKENLQLYEKLKDFEQGGQKISEEELKYRIAMQVYEGKPASQADLSREESIYEQAVSLCEAVKETAPEAADRAAAALPEGRELTLRDILENEKETTKAGEKAPAEEYARGEKENAGERTEDSGESLELLTARRQLEEVRLRMSVEANVKLLRSGFQIDTAPMEQLIERLRAAEEALAGQGILQTAEAVEKMEELRAMPLATLGFVVSREISFTIEALHERGSVLQGEFESGDVLQNRRDAANRRYETMQTEVRADLGDSIRKAFRNVDDILADMNREPSEENRRAVRMLGYNQLEVSEENLDRAIRIDEQVQRLFRDMKPGRVLQMIRDGVDVLHTDIGELDAYLTAQGEDFLEQSEDFARFLHKLDQNGGITGAERESYIGIYRLVRQVEKSDGRAQGYLLGSGAEMTMENLLAAVRSGKRGTLDYRIDESFAGVDALQRGKSILEQINALPYESSKGYEEAMQALEGADRREEQFRREAVEFLRETGDAVTISNLVEASSVIQEDVGLYRKLEEYDREKDAEERLKAEESRFERAVENLQDAVGDEESLQEGMEAFAGQAEEILREAQTKEGVTELDIRDMQRLCRGIRFRTAISKESRYQIPVKLESGYAVMNLTVRKGIGEAQAEISIRTEEFGRLEAVFAERGGTAETGGPGESAARTAAGRTGEEAARTETGGEREAAAAKAERAIRGTLFAETREGETLLREVADRVKKRLDSAGIPAEDMTVLQGIRVRKSAFSTQTEGTDGNGSAEKSGRKEISAGELYQIAKIFLETVRNER